MGKNMEDDKEGGESSDLVSLCISHNSVKISISFGLLPGKMSEIWKKLKNTQIITYDFRYSRSFFS